jgi:hypothetical protein
MMQQIASNTVARLEKAAHSCRRFKPRRIATLSVAELQAKEGFRDKESFVEGNAISTSRGAIGRDLAQPGSLDAMVTSVSQPSTPSCGLPVSVTNTS